MTIHTHLLGPLGLGTRPACRGGTEISKRSLSTFLRSNIKCPQCLRVAASRQDLSSLFEKDIDTLRLAEEKAILAKTNQGLASIFMAQLSVDHTFYREEKKGVADA